MNPQSAASLTNLNSVISKYRVNKPGVEVVRQSLYDYQTYASGGQTSLTFFQIPIGQSSKTDADTSMTLGGQLPAGQRFLITAIQLAFFPGGAVSDFDAVAAALPSQGDDAYTFHKSGVFTLTIGSKQYLVEAPLGRFPTDFGVQLMSSETSNSATTGLHRTELAKMVGQKYRLTPPILLEPTQNFNVTLKWPTAVAMPSGVAARVGVIFDGLLYRNSQ